MSGRLDARNLALKAPTAIMVVCAAVLLVTATVVAVPTLRDYLTSSREPAPYSRGQLINVPASLYSKPGRTVLIFSRVGCAACERSRAQFAALVRTLRARDDARVVLVTPTGLPDEESVFADAIGIDRSAIVRMDLLSAGVRRVPSVAVVNAQGAVQAFYEGVLSDVDRDAILSQVN